jgi:hypothetical protein
MIFVWSIQHTGTWTTLDWLSRHAKVDGLATEQHLAAVLAGDTFVHQLNNLAEGIEPRTLTERWGGSPVIQSHIHIGADRKIDSRALALACSLPTVIPLRDPLACCLTAWRRLRMAGGGMLPNPLLLRWRALARTWKECKFNCYLLPWDYGNLKTGQTGVPGTDHNLELHLSACSLHLGIREDNLDFDFFQEASVSNSQGVYGAKTRYEAGDAEWIAQRHPALWKLLRESETELRPFLEAAGYRGLMWWS